MFFLYFLCLLALVMKTTDLAIPKGQKCEIVNLDRASDISRGRGPAKFPKKREIPRNPPEIFPITCRQNIFNTYLGY